MTGSRRPHGLAGIFSGVIVLTVTGVIVLDLIIAWLATAIRGSLRPARRDPSRADPGRIALWLHPGSSGHSARPRGPGAEALAGQLPLGSSDAAGIPGSAAGGR
jgi:hypothetical protein